ncbi:MAG: RsmG family class I SAM-dependent methyltransferase, partial [Acidimicrobiales bacterium]
LLGPGPLEPHLVHGLGFAQAFSAAGAAQPSFDDAPRDSTPAGSSAPASVLDLGSGGGLPGLVLAVFWRHTTLTLLDAQHRSAAFLSEAADRLGLSERVVVLEGRAEELGRRPEWRGGFDVVVARSFARPAVTAECAAPFLRPAGVLVVSEPPAATGRAAAPTPGAGHWATDRESAGGKVLTPEVGAERWPAAGLALLGMDPALAVPGELHFVVVRQHSACPERFPRRVGVPAKRPLF